MLTAASHSVLDPAGVQAAAIGRLWWLMFWIAAAIFVVVLLCVTVATLRHRRREPAAEDAVRPALARSVGAAVGASVLILIGLLVASVVTGRAMGTAQPPGTLTVEITGHQWWWEIHYEEGVPSERIATANEFHIPIGRPVVLKVTSRDVIHSFWAPNLQGKRDLIPGYTTAIWLQADRPGTFRSQCAEFCGLQHAHMVLDVVAEPEPAFEAWAQKMRQPAPEPSSGQTTRGRDVFMRARCAGCHTVRGTDAAGAVGPDLTHMAGRATLGAGALPNTAGALRTWLADPQAAKPGNQMPPNPLAGDDLIALVSYLETLQ